MFEVDDVRKTFADQKARGVKFVDAQPRKEWWGFSADLVDPDVNHFTINRTAVYNYFQMHSLAARCDSCGWAELNEYIRVLSWVTDQKLVLQTQPRGLKHGIRHQE